MCASPDNQDSHDFSEAFYRQHARRYAEVSHRFLQSVYLRSSHATLLGDLDLLERLQELAIGRRGLDAGCGAGARDVYYFWRRGYDIYGLDAVEENIRHVKERHPEIADRVTVADLRAPLPFMEACFDFILCNAVIQHIAPTYVFEITLYELARVLSPGGVLQLMFKHGHGIQTVYDRDYGAERTFLLYDEHDVLRALKSYGLTLVEAKAPDRLGGIMYFTDPKPVDHCVFFVRKIP